MSVEWTEKSKVQLTFTVTADKFKEGLLYSYNKNKGSISIPGFRKGKAPRKVIERTYGADYFYDDAINFVLPDAYEQACEENEIEPVCKPKIELTEANESEGCTFVAEIYVKPEVLIDGYYGLTYTHTETRPTEGEIQEKLQQEREKNARQISVDRPAEMGDVVSINFKGFVDGEAFEGGEEKDYELKLGSRAFIGNFEEQLAGHVPGDDITVLVTFPEDYHHRPLAGKPARFEVEMLDVKAFEYPEINDDFAQDVSEFDTLAEYREDISKKLKESKEQFAKREKSAQVVQKLVEKAVMDVPEAMYEARLDEMMMDFEQRVTLQGMQMDPYLQYMNTTKEALRASWRPQAAEGVNGDLALEAVAKKENMDVSEEEYTGHIQKMAERTRQDPEAFLRKITPAAKKSVMNDLLIQKALDFVLEKAVAVEGEVLTAVKQ